MNDDEPGGTLAGLARSQCAQLCRAIGHDGQSGQMASLVGDVVLQAGDRPLSAPPIWSGITEDCTPFEFSIAVRATRVDLRFLIEAHAEPASPQRYWEAGQALTSWLCRQFKLDAAPLHALEDLFQPRDPAVFWSIWHGLDLADHAKPLVKVYLNPSAQGAARGPQTVKQALFRLGLGEAWPGLAEIPGEGDQFMFLSLDLGGSTGARVKVFVRHCNVSLERLEFLHAGADSKLRDDIRAFCAAVAGERLGMRPVLSVFVLTEGSLQPVRTIIDMPVFGHARNEGAAVEALSEFLRGRGLPDSQYRAGVEVLRRRPLELESGLQTFASFQRIEGSPVCTIYLGPRAYCDRFGWQALDPVSYWPSPIQKVRRHDDLP